MAISWLHIKEKLNNKSKKDVYLLIAVYILGFLSVSLLYDVLFVFILEDPENTPQAIAQAMLVRFTV